MTAPARLRDGTVDMLRNVRLAETHYVRADYVAPCDGSKQRRLKWLSSLRFDRDGALLHDAVDPDTGEVVSAAEDRRKIAYERFVRASKAGKKSVPRRTVDGSLASEDALRVRGPSLPKNPHGARVGTRAGLARKRARKARA